MQVKSLLALLAGGLLLSAPTVHAAGDYQSGSAGSMQQGAAQSGQDSMQQQAATGEHSEAIKKVQQALNDQGFAAGPVDGIMGDKTQRALTNFQQAQGMQASGDIDESTLNALGLDASASEFSAFVEEQQDSGATQDGGAMQDGGGMEQEPGVDTRDNGISSPGTP